MLFFLCRLVDFYRLTSERRLEPLSHLYALVLLRHAQNPLKIFPKSIVLSYWSFGPRLPPLPLTVAVTFQGKSAYSTLFWSPSIPYCSGECLTCLLKCCHAHSLAPVLVKKPLLIANYLKTWYNSTTKHVKVCCLVDSRLRGFFYI